MAVLGKIRQRSIFLILVIGMALFAFVISGVFESLSREALTEKIEFNGGSVVSSISKKTDYVVAGNGIGPNKKSKAEMLGVPIIDVATFFELLLE